MTVKKMIACICICVFACSMTVAAQDVPPNMPEDTDDAMGLDDMPIDVPYDETADDIYEYGYGTVIAVDIAGRTITINEYDWETDAEKEALYILHEDAEIENPDDPGQIPAGSYVDIDYLVDDDGKNIITYISVYPPEPEM